MPDTDWFVPKLYDFLMEMDVTVIIAGYSRYVIDLNRPPDNKNLYSGTFTSALCPDKLFNGNPVYQDAVIPDEEEVTKRLALFWRPYHQALAEQINRIKDKFGYCVLYDAHSIRSHVPLLFDGKLTDLNLGTNKGASCPERLQKTVEQLMHSNNEFSCTSNGRFIGGYITRHYGQPERHIYALQMEIGQNAYLADSVKPVYHTGYAAPLRQFLTCLFNELLSWEADNI